MCLCDAGEELSGTEATGFAPRCHQDECHFLGMRSKTRKLETQMHFSDKHVLFLIRHLSGFLRIIILPRTRNLCFSASSFRRPRSQVCPPVGAQSLGAPKSPSWERTWGPAAPSPSCSETKPASSSGEMPSYNDLFFLMECEFLSCWHLQTYLREGARGLAA